MKRVKLLIMALASHCYCSSSSQLLLGLKRSTPIPTLLSPIQFPNPSKLRSNAAVRLQIRRKLPIVLASKPSGGNSTEKKSDDAPQGPPLLTILAGLIVFFLVFWIAKSIITGLIGFLVSFIPFK